MPFTIYKHYYHWKILRTKQTFPFTTRPTHILSSLALLPFVTKYILSFTIVLFFSLSLFLFSLWISFPPLFYFPTLSLFIFLLLKPFISFFFFPPLFSFRFLLLLPLFPRLFLLSLSLSPLSSFPSFYLPPYPFLPAFFFLLSSFTFSSLPFYYFSFLYSFHSFISSFPFSVRSPKLFDYFLPIFPIPLNFSLLSIFFFLFPRLPFPQKLVNISKILVSNL